jgi:hypothetical protein
MMPGNGRGHLSGEQAASNTPSPVTGSAVDSKPAGGSAAAEWRTEALHVITVLSRTGQTLDVDLVLMLTGLPPSPNHIGSVFAPARQQKIIEAVGAKVGDGGRLIRIYVRCHR